MLYAAYTLQYTPMVRSTVGPKQFYWPKLVNTSSNIDPAQVHSEDEYYGNYIMCNHMVNAGS